MIALNTSVDCGAVQLQFIDQTGEVLNSNFFAVGQEAGVTQVFTVLKQESSASLGEYKIRYKAWLKDHPQVIVFLDQPFIVRIEEPIYESDIIVNVPPDWLLQLEDQTIRKGENLLYLMGDNLNMFGEETKVSLQLQLDSKRFISYQPDFNAFIVLGVNVMDTDIRDWTITVTSEYVDLKGKYFKF